MAAGLAGDVDGERVEAGLPAAAAPGDDLQLLFARLVVELENEEAVGEPARQRAVPTSSSGLAAPTTVKPGLASTRPSRGTSR